MTPIRNILLSWAGLFLFSLSVVAQQQGIPLLNETRVGKTEKYSVCPSLPRSIFQWKVEQGGVVVRQSRTQPCDTLVVGWGFDPGDYLVEVSEISEMGCVGQPFIGKVTVKDALPPVAAPDINYLFPSATVSGSVATNDYSLSLTPDPLVFTLLSPAPEGFVFQPDGSYTYQPSAFPASPVAVKYRASYQSRPTNSTASTLWIYPVTGQPDQLPFATADWGMAFEGGRVTGNLLANDFETGKKEIILNQTPLAGVAHGDLTLYPDGGYRYIPQPGFTGTDSFTYEIYDATAPTRKNSVKVELEVRKKESDLINLPTIVADDAWFTDGEAISATLVANDYNTDQDQLSYTAVSGTGPVHGELVFNSDGSFSYTPHAGYVGTDRFVYSVCDSGEPQYCLKGTAYFVVTEPLVKLTANAGPDQTISYCRTIQLDGSGSTGKGLSYQWTAIDFGMELTNATSAKPEVKLSTDYFSGGKTLPATFMVQLEVTDQAGKKEKDVVAITVNVAPEAIIQQIGYADKNGKLVLDGSSSKGNGLTYQWSSFTGQIIGQADGPQVTIGKAGSYQLTVTDQYGCSDSETLVPELTEHILSAYDDYARRSWADTARIEILYNDYDSRGDIDRGSVRITVQPGRGSARVNSDGTVSYLPKERKAGRDQFVYEVCDSADLCDEAMVIIDLYDQDIKINEGFSPNGDGVNDTFELGGLEAFPGSTLVVYDRAGVEVYKSDDYRNTWDGRAKSKYYADGKLVPQGVYYYILKLGGDAKRTIKGYIFVAY